jgi:hypothetical protein
VIKNIFKILSFRIVAIALLLTLLSSNTFVIAQYMCSYQMEQTSEEGCCCHQNKNMNTNDNAELTRSDCGCCITQGQPVDNSLPPVTISSNNLIQDHQYVQSDINTQNFYTAEFNILTSQIPLITQDINILNANLRI